MVKRIDRLYVAAGHGGVTHRKNFSGVTQTRRSPGLLVAVTNRLFPAMGMQGTWIPQMPKGIGPSSWSSRWKAIVRPTIAC